MVQRIAHPIKRAFQRILDQGALSGVLLFIATILALIWANAPFGDTYFALWHETIFKMEAGSFVIKKDLLHLINDGLMAIFFFVIGLEIKRELMVGELSSFRKAFLPMIAAVGGMVAPALLYLLLNAGTEGVTGWGIPMATDIAFAIGILAILGNVPLPLKVFLVTLAVVDDIGAVLVIALFYSSDISLFSLGLGALFLGVMLAGNFMNVRNPWFYAIIGIGGLWLAFLLSGVHATIAGVVAAFAIPTTVRLNPTGFKEYIQKLLADFDKLPTFRGNMLSEAQEAVLIEVERTASRVEPPLQRLERMLHPFVMYFVMPLFALSNAGIVLSDEIAGVFGHPVSLGIIIGLIFGKLFGITLFSWIACKVGLASLPTGVKWKQIIGVALLAGVGFTMSLFISGLAFDNPDIEVMSKAGILTASLIAGVCGYIILKRTLKDNNTLSGTTDYADVTDK